MAVTWKVAGMARHTSMGSKSDVVYRIDWVCSDSETVDDVVHTGTCKGQVPLQTDRLSPFTAFANIKEAKAIEWAKESLGVEEVALIEARVQKEIYNSKAPPTKVGVPWS